MKLKDWVYIGFAVWALLAYIAGTQIADNSKRRLSEYRNFRNWYKTDFRPGRHGITFHGGKEQ